MQLHECAQLCIRACCTLSLRSVAIRALTLMAKPAHVLLPGASFSQKGCRRLRCARFPKLAIIPVICCLLDPTLRATLDFYVISANAQGISTSSLGVTTRTNGPRSCHSPTSDFNRRMGRHRTSVQRVPGCTTWRRVFAALAAK